MWKIRDLIEPRVYIKKGYEEKVDLKEDDRNVAGRPLLTEEPEEIRGTGMLRNKDGVIKEVMVEGLVFIHISHATADILYRV